MIDSSVDYKNLPRPTWAEIDIDAILNNINEYKKALGNKVEIIVAAKGNGYGHGMLPIVKAINELDIYGFATGNMYEAIEMRKHGIDKPMQNKDHISYQVALNIKQAVEEKTEGRVLIDIYPANQLGDWSQVYDELMMGSIDMAHSSVPETYDARTAVGYFPYLSSSYDQLGEIFAEGSSLDNMMKEIQAKNGIEFCGFFVEGIAGIGTTKEVSNPNTLDSKNTVIRTAAMDCYILPCEYMGFDTTSIASSDTFAALQTGVVEGLAGSTPAGAYLNYRDIIDYYYVYQMSPEVTQIMISEKTLAKLSPEDQKTIVDICRQECANSVNYAKDEDEKYLKLMEDNGIKIVRFTDEEIEMFAEAVRTNVWPQLAKTYGEDFINELLKLYK